MLRLLSLVVFGGDFLQPQVVAQDNENNIIDVWGQTPNDEQTKIQPGKNKILRPTHLNAYHLNNSLKKISGFYVPDTGKNQNSNFNVPRTRGYDARYTEVFVGDILLQDPYTGFTLSDDLDVREFGEVDIFQGWPDLKLASANPLGVVRFLPVFAGNNEWELGIDSGQYTGNNHWLIAKNLIQRDATLIQARTFISYQYSKGAFPYYDDKMTPYNSNDDAVEFRNNNDQKSHKLTHSLKILANNWTLQLTLRKSGKKRGLPAPSVLTQSHARESAQNLISDVSLKYRPETVGRMFNLGMGLKYYRDILESHDAERVLLRTQKAGLTATTQTFRLFLEQNHAIFSSNCQESMSRSRIAVDLGTLLPGAVMRESNHLYCGLGLKLSQNMEIQGKADYVQNRDKEVATSLGANENTTTHAVGRSKGVGFVSEVAEQTIYANFMVKNFPPSLVAQLGNASTIAPNPDLQNEKIIHREFGASFFLNADKKVKSSISLFRDNLTQKIVFVPTSFASSKAINYGDFRVDGFEIDFSINRDFGVWHGNFTRIFPVNLNMPEYSFIAGFPHDQGSNEILLFWRKLSFAVVSYYRGQVSLDETGLKTLSPAVTHDISISKHDSLFGQVLEFMFLIQNVTDKKRNPVFAKDFPENSGYTAYAQVEGYPLPGRNIQMSLALKF